MVGESSDNHGWKGWWVMAVERQQPSSRVLLWIVMERMREMKGERGDNKVCTSICDVAPNLVQLDSLPRYLTVFLLSAEKEHKVFYFQQFWARAIRKTIPKGAYGWRLHQLGYVESWKSKNKKRLFSFLGGVMLDFTTRITPPIPQLVSQALPFWVLWPSNNFQENSFPVGISCYLLTLSIY